MAIDTDDCIGYRLSTFILDKGVVVDPLQTPQNDLSVNRDAPVPPAGRCKLNLTLIIQWLSPVDTCVAVL